jgi:hypothetical protein
MNTVGRSVMIAESRLSKQLAANDDSAANEEEIEEQIEEDNVEKTARENGSSVSAPFMSNKQIETADDALASKEEVEEQAQESRIDKVAFEDGISKAAATEYIGSGRDHD